MLRRMIVISWRAILRNRRRTVITSTAIGIGLASLLFTDALFAGLIDFMVDTATETWIGHVQIHGDAFRETGRIALTISDPAGVMDKLEGDTLVRGFTGRLITPATLESSMELRPITLTGVDHTTDPDVTSLSASIAEGGYFTGDSTELIIGEKLAEDMELQLGDIAVLTAAAADGGFSSSLFIVAGICSFNSEKLDRYSAFVNIEAAEDMLVLDGEYHEIAVLFGDPQAAEEHGERFRRMYGVEGNTAEIWPVLQPQIHSMVQMVDVSVTVMAAILFGLVLFGIVNSLFMSVYERMYEFGVMKALGTRTAVISGLVLLEAFWLGLAAIVIGSVIGWAVVSYFGAAGLSFGEMEFTGLALNRPIYPVFEAGRIWIYPLITLVFTTLAGVYPGVHAGRLNPSEAIRRSL